jgi:hypothetical protein
MFLRINTVFDELLTTKLEVTSFFFIRIRIYLSKNVPEEKLRNLIFWCDELVPSAALLYFGCPSLWPRDKYNAVFDEK